MSKWLRRVAIAIASLGGTLLLLLLVAYVLSARRLNQSYTFAPRILSFAPADANIENGQRLASMYLCTACHGEDLSGQILADDFLFGRISSKNLTSGRGGIATDDLELALVRAIRHGIDRDGKPLVAMPSNDFAHISDADLADIVAYVKSVSPVDNELPDRRLGPVARGFIASGVYSLPASVIDHSTTPTAPEPGITAVYGEYLARFCMGCHGKDLGGGEPGPGPPAGPNLTRGGRLANWNENDFVRTLRTGRLPDGTELGDAMPWRAAAAMTDEEMTALWMYLRSIPPVSGAPNEAVRDGVRGTKP